MKSGLYYEIIIDLNAITLREIFVFDRIMYLAFGRHSYLNSYQKWG